MKIAYCQQCKLATAAGPLPETVVVRGRKVPYMYTHVVDGQRHTCVLVEVPEDAQRPGEDVGSWLARLVKDNAAALG
jgi:hypothetical protein